ncbi:uncharacterized protein [Littorina saxatilis]|uniref:JmjC domain-containing protein n=1 Tax=Littorina saxatilis TaxID=31220 RepID=A0AAN9AUN7_9CAEN
MKTGPRAPKSTWKSASGSNSVAMVSWAALISMFSAVFISIMWEMYNQPPKVEVQKNETYKYPSFVLDFDEALEERERLAEYYGAKADPGVERRSGLSLEEFWDLYDAKWPVIVTDVVPKWPAYEKWTREFLNSTYGKERVVMVATKGKLEDKEGMSLPMFGFVEHTSESSPDYWTYLTDEFFITTRPQLRKDVLTSIYTEEDFFQLFPREIRPWDCMLLWGTAHSRSALHIDPYNWTGTNAVLWGTKKWKLFPPGQDHLLYVFQNQKCGFPLDCFKYNSPIDSFASKPETHKKYPNFQSARWIEVEQKAGEILIIPTGWFHQAYNAEETLAVSGQMMNRNNYRYVLEEILKVGNLQRKQLPEGFHNLLPPDQVTILMSLLPRKILRKGKAVTDDYLKQVKDGKGGIQ